VSAGGRTTAPARSDCLIHEVRAQLSVIKCGNAAEKTIVRTISEQVRVWIERLCSQQLFQKKNKSCVRNGRPIKHASCKNEGSVRLDCRFVGRCSVGDNWAGALMRAPFALTDPHLMAKNSKSFDPDQE
jgi:hypothetical protein